MFKNCAGAIKKDVILTKSVDGGCGAQPCTDAVDPLLIDENTYTDVDGECDVQPRTYAVDPLFIDENTYTGADGECGAQPCTYAVDPLFIDENTYTGIDAFNCDQGNLVGQPQLGLPSYCAEQINL